MARARSTGSPDLKIPEPTNTASAPSCIISDASAGVATPPAETIAATGGSLSSPGVPSRERLLDGEAPAQPISENQPSLLPPHGGDSDQAENVYESNFDVPQEQLAQKQEETKAEVKEESKSEVKTEPDAVVDLDEATAPTDEIPANKEEEGQDVKMEPVEEEEKTEDV